ncbi:MAG: type ISP restriction/modification enzyme [Candidatus Andersenbacteria bacterium]
MADNQVRHFIDEVRKKQTQSEAREHAYRPLLENLLSALLSDKYSVINDPAKVGHNAPDFLIKQGEVPCGYIEAKDITVDLSDKAVQKQAERYLEAFDSLILTNYREFRFYLHDEEYAKLTLDDKTSEADLKRFTDLVTQFVQIAPTKIKSAKQLAEIMAHKSRIMRDVVIGLLKEQDQTGDIQGQYQAFKQVLIRDLTIEQFADMYTQTLTYGLFVARYFDDSLKNFSRHEAQDLLPPANPLLRKFFGHIAGSSFEPRLAWIIDDLIQAYRAADVSVIMHKEFEQKSKDPVLHFYETYLQEYDPKLRKSRGVYYTPEPVVSFIVRSVDEILKRDFGIKDGLADTSTIPWKFKTQNADKRGKAVKEVTKDVHRVQILDPAAGTGTFLVEVIKEIRKRFKNQEGQWPSYVKEHLLPRLHGFELMMASYTMAHLKLGITLGETGYKDTDKRLGVYLTNSLEQGVTEVPNLFMSQWLTEESAAASKVKSELPIMVVIGNPPYDVSSSNKGEWIQNMIKVYKQGLNEKKINLDDDYIKFIRFAENLINKNGMGVVAMITNNSFIDGNTHRQMRKHLLETFDDIYVLNLHGSTKKKEIAPNGGKDENVFEIQQGVAITIFARHLQKKVGLGAVHFAELYGKQMEKLSKLGSMNLAKTEWAQLDVVEPHYFFVPKDFGLEKEYSRGFKVDDLFSISTSGIETQKDVLVIQFTHSDLKRVRADIESADEEKVFSQYGIKNSRDWNFSSAKKDLEDAADTQILYRPFDKRWTFYSGKTKGIIAYPRGEVMKHLTQENIALLTTKRVSSFPEWHHVLVSENIAERCAVSLQTSEVGYIFPLYVYKRDGSKDPNLDKTIVDKIESLAGKTKPEDIFDYVYAVVHSLYYRHKYKEFLKIDFPRVPYPKDKKQFQKLVEFGKELRELHLMSSPNVNEFITTYPIAGSNMVEKPTFKEGKAWINKEQYFGGVPETAWEFYIGGYKPAQKWLKDRKGRELSSDDIAHYQRIIKVLVETKRVMGEIDKSIKI